MPFVLASDNTCSSCADALGDGLWPPWLEANCRPEGRTHGESAPPTHVRLLLRGRRDGPLAQRAVAEGMHLVRQALVAVLSQVGLERRAARRRLLVRVTRDVLWASTSGKGEGGEWGEREWWGGVGWG